MAEPMNANTSNGATNSQDASARMSKALQYKAAKAAESAAPPPREQSSHIADDVTGAAELKQMLLKMQGGGDGGALSVPRRLCSRVS